MVFHGASGHRLHGVWVLDGCSGAMDRFSDNTLGAEFLDRLRHDPDIFLSPVSRWEITVKQATGKLTGPTDLTERVRDMGFRELPVTDVHAIAAGRLPPHHGDPF